PAQAGVAAEPRARNGSSPQHANGSLQPADTDGREEAQPAPLDVSDIGAAFRRWDAMGER
ncbi:MAG TPA: hypothetical protein VIP46_21195, partial [Pyrinomonadaceae bacterium]